MDATAADLPDRPTPARSPVLVLHERDAPFETLRLAELLASRAGAAVTAFGHASILSAYRQAAAVLRRSPDTVVHAMGGPALAVALTTRANAIAYTAVRPPTGRDVAWLRAALRYRTVTVICDSESERRRWVTGGVPHERCVLVRPGVSLAQPADARMRARARLGLTDASYVLFSPLPRSGPARAGALWTGSLFQVLNPDCHHIAWNPPGGRDLRSLRSRLINPAAVHIVEEPTPETGFAAADAVLLPPGDALSPTIVAMAMASGRPIVATATPGMCELLEDRHTAWLAGQPTAKAMAQRLRELRDDPALARQTADRARAEVYELFLASRLVRDFRNVYAALSAARPALLAS